MITKREDPKIIREAVRNGASFRNEEDKNKYYTWIKKDQTFSGITFFILVVVLMGAMVFQDYDYERQLDEQKTIYTHSIKLLSDVCEERTPTLQDWFDSLRNDATKPLKN